MQRVELTMMTIAAALIVLISLSAEHERIFSQFIEAIQQGNVCVTALRDHRLVGEFPGHRFWMNAHVTDSGRRHYGLAVKAFIESVRVGPFSFESGTIGSYTVDTQTLLAQQFGRLLAQNRRFVPPADEVKAPFEFLE